MTNNSEWERALDCAARQFETYARRGQIGTPEDRRIALSDALQHAIGLLRMHGQRPAQTQREGT